tara:strand:- start:4668 stop:5114 length:447 start_codon:yes stop_codon:yes gene_type:complete
MSSVNTIQILGNLGEDPKLSFTTSGQPVCNLRVATNEQFRVDGELRQHTEWHRVVVWGKNAENCAEYLKKGRQVYVEGRMKFRKYDKVEEHEVEGTGEKVKVKITRTVGELVSRNVQFLGAATGKNTPAEAPKTEEKAPEENPEDAPF